jgi:hypothetical protein
MAILGPSNRLISPSKTRYREANADHVAVLNANVCIAAGKVWWGDFDLTVDESQLLDRQQWVVLQTGGAPADTSIPFKR